MKKKIILLSILTLVNHHMNTEGAKFDGLVKVQDLTTTKKKGKPETKPKDDLNKIKDINGNQNETEIVNGPVGSQRSVGNLNTIKDITDKQNEQQKLKSHDDDALIGSQVADMFNDADEKQNKKELEFDEKLVILDTLEKNIDKTREDIDNLRNMILLSKDLHEQQQEEINRHKEKIGQHEEAIRQHEENNHKIKKLLATKAG